MVAGTTGFSKEKRYGGPRWPFAGREKKRIFLKSAGFSDDRHLGGNSDVNVPKENPVRQPGPRAVRWKRVAELREEIRRGAYDSPEKWDRVLDRLLRDLRKQS
jgi:hypothetical protein